MKKCSVVIGSSLLYDLESMITGLLIFANRV